MINARVLDGARVLSNVSDAVNSTKAPKLVAPGL